MTCRSHFTKKRREIFLSYCSIWGILVVRARNPPWKGLSKKAVIHLGACVCRHNWAQELERCQSSVSFSAALDSPAQGGQNGHQQPLPHILLALPPWHLLHLLHKVLERTWIGPSSGDRPISKPIMWLGWWGPSRWLCEVTLASYCRPAARVGTGLSPPKRCGMGFSCGEGIEGEQVTDIHYPGSATNWFRDFGSNNFSALSLSFFISKMEGLIRGFQNLLYL